MVRFRHTEVHLRLQQTLPGRLRQHKHIVSIACPPPRHADAAACRLFSSARFFILPFMLATSFCFLPCPVLPLARQAAHKQLWPIRAQALRQKCRIRPSGFSRGSADGRDRKPAARRSAKLELCRPGRWNKNGSERERNWSGSMPNELHDRKNAFH